jgi:hypothetical protein
MTISGSSATKLSSNSAQNLPAQRNENRMRRTLSLLVALMGFSLVAVPTFAQRDNSDVEVRYKKKTEIDFEDVSVDGELKKPHGAYLLDKRQSSFNPLIRLKENFNEEMVNSVNQIR